MTDSGDRARDAVGSTRGATPVGDTRTKKRPWWLLALIGLLLLGLLLFGLSRCGGDDEDTASTTTTASTDPSTVATPTQTVSASPSDPASASASTSASASATGAPPAGGGVLTAGSTNVLPLSAAGVPATGDLSQFTGQQVTGKGVTVQSVPSDEGFWVGTSATDRVWVQLAGPGESPFKVQPGQKVDFSGTMTAHTAAFTQQAGVTTAEGAAQLTAQKQHVETPKSALALSA